MKQSFETNTHFETNESETAPITKSVVGADIVGRSIELDVPSSEMY